MPGENAIQRMLDQLSTVLQMTQNASLKTLKGPLPPDWQQRLSQLKLMVMEFQQLNEKILADTGLSKPVPEDQPVKDLSKELSEKERLILERANQLARDASKGSQYVGFSINELKKQKKPATRQKKFDRLGARKKWKPM